MVITAAHDPTLTFYFFGTGPIRVPATYWRLKRL
jgi:hypothetical protein